MLLCKQRINRHAPRPFYNSIASSALMFYNHFCTINICGAKFPYSGHSPSDSHAIPDRSGVIKGFNKVNSDSACLSKAGQLGNVYKYHAV